MAYRRGYRVVLTLAVLLMQFSASTAQAQARNQDLTAITARIQAESERIIEELGIPAISIALVSEGEVIWAEAFGYANVGASVRASADTYFSTGSTLKPVTAAAIMHLAEAGKLLLDTPFNEIVGPDKSIEGAEDVTLRHMLTHHSGLEGPLTIVPLWSRQSLLTPDALLAGTKRIGPPGVEYAYCNICYALAGHVIERLSGQSFDAYLFEHVFRPLGVEATTLSKPTPKVVEHLALPYESTRGVATPIEQIRTDVFAAGDAYLRAKDMAAFLAVLVNGGTYAGHRLLSEESVAEILKPFGTSSSGLGVNLGELSGRNIFSKNGIFTGYHSYMIGDQASRSGVYIAANSTVAGRPIALLSRFALRLIWGEQPDPLPSFIEGR